MLDFLDRKIRWKENMSRTAYLKDTYFYYLILILNFYAVTIFKCLFSYKKKNIKSIL